MDAEKELYWKRGKFYETARAQKCCPEIALTEHAGEGESQHSLLPPVHMTPEQVSLFKASHMEFPS